jgi:hypothetical protein
VGNEARYQNFLAAQNVTELYNALQDFKPRTQNETRRVPALKVAAIHDPHKTLGITLQFIGRFARVSNDSIGDATVVVSRTDPNYDENLKQLYAEDADWNHVIRNLSAAAIGEQESMGEFEDGFRSLPEEVSMRNIAPKMSTVAYKTHCANWEPEKLTTQFADKLFTNPVAINETEHVAWLVTKEVTPVKWGDLRTIEEITYDLYVFYWDPNQKLLYINSSNNDSVHEALAKLVCGDTVERIKGAVVYRTMANINRRVPSNVGLLDAVNRNRRFAMLVGTNVTEAFPTAEAQTKTQTNIFAYGFQNGQRVSVGASLKGRIWSHRAADTLMEWVEWCDVMGGQLVDENINIEDVIAGFIQPKDVVERPALVPLALEWSPAMLSRISENLHLQFNGQSWPLIDTDLVITDFSTTGPISFKLVSPHWEANYTLTLGNNKLEFRPVAAEAMVVTARNTIPLTTFLNQYGLIVIFEKEAIVDPNAILVQPNRDLPPFPVDKLQVLDWSGIDLSVESQGKERKANSIQAHTIQHILGLADWDIVMDDDGPGEVADIVAARIDGNKLIVKLVHCKFSTGAPGARVADLYEVCGQAAKSMRWRRRADHLFLNLIRREKQRRANGGNGLMKGTDQKLYELAEKSPLLLKKFSVVVVQPGVSRARVSSQQLDLLACTEVYVQDTADSTFEVITSA